MIDQIGTDEINRRVTSKRNVSKTVGLLTVAAMVGAIMVIWSAFLLWAAYRLGSLAFGALGL